MNYSINYAGENTIAYANNPVDAEFIAKGMLALEGFKDDEIEFDKISSHIFSLTAHKKGNTVSIMVYDIS